MGGRNHFKIGVEFVARLSGDVGGCRHHDHVGIGTQNSVQWQFNLDDVDLEEVFTQRVVVEKLPYFF